jgi:hypothetical protein
MMFMVDRSEECPLGTWNDKMCGLAGCRMDADKMTRISRDETK